MAKKAKSETPETESAPPVARPSTPKKEKVGKLVKKDKTRLPRKEKKALQKATAKKQAKQ